MTLVLPYRVVVEVLWISDTSTVPDNTNIRTIQVQVLYLVHKIKA